MRAAGPQTETEWAARFARMSDRLTSEAPRLSKAMDDARCEWLSFVEDTPYSHAEMVAMRAISR